MRVLDPSSTARDRQSFAQCYIATRSQTACCHLVVEEQPRAPDPGPVPCQRYNTRYFRPGSRNDAEGAIGDHSRQQVRLPVVQRRLASETQDRSAPRYTECQIPTTPAGRPTTPVSRHGEL